MVQEIYVNKKWTKTNEELEVINPYSLEVVDSTYLATEKLVEEAVQCSQEALEKSKSIKTYQRAEILEYIANSLEKNKEELSILLAKEGGKPIDLALDEINRGISTFKLSAQHIMSNSGELMPLDMTEKSGNRFGLVKQFPIGIVYGISPFNFPLNLVAHKVAPAIASGCPIILKPASATPLTSLKLAQYFDEACDKYNFEKGLFQVLPMNRQVGDLLVEDERIALLSFTGSPHVGWAMKNRAGKKKVVLELGGDAGLYVHKDVDINWASKIAALGAFANGGQVCISVQRLIIHEEIYEKFMKSFLKHVSELKIGDTLVNGNLVGPLIDLKNKQRILNWITEAKDKGVEILAGGDEISETLVAPTVLENTPKGLQISDEEAFGPIVNVYKVKNSKEGFDKINDSKFGLQCGILTNSAQIQYDAFEKCDVAGVVINDFPTFRVDNMPYGGVKESGFGREGVKYAIDDMTELKVMVVNRNYRYEEE